ncbi:TPA: rRNA maturation RNase YbeY [Candidatus Berkelbacteria bacterium]|uniref:Endoribonuclease YbeY n=1 Tax=Berkelbacteria bacterium GW2011_GWE1_39_12 TaxID=1618337 RepID=A0A0G4B2P2_9BACT|nr:MAG: hypothetical protein UT28_C0001G0006 [Berkelbacteria bacterium GW2011_GWE1_39_12]HBO60074.1 rRNA maturation RNase YbeY [Candidatus Berkelbacteria bacterium]
MKIELNIENKTLYKIPTKNKIKQAILDVLETKKVISDVIVGLQVTDKKEIQKLNKKFRLKDKPTDVLSFPIYEVTPKVSDAPLLLGDIIVCYDVMAENAKTYEVSEDEEFLKLVSHSTLHLLGFHHKGD